ncbi:MAG: hypothetical protein SO119_08110, partial [Phascolarctobacterium sp.]|nr:hypothetical protein [Phascolarctobacterium sp.]
NLATGLILQSDSNGKVVESSFPITSLNVLTGMESDRPIQEQLDEIKSTTSAKPLSFENRIVTAWTEVGETPYGYKGNLPLNDVTSQDYAQVVFNTTDSLSGKYAPYCETYDGGVYIWSTTNVAVTLPMVFVTKG